VVIVTLYNLIGINFGIFNSSQMIMKNDIDSLRIRLKELDEKIKAVEKQLPAHSVKPPMMAQLFELEDERDAIFKALEHFKQGNPGC
jgi:hypothetical protein